MSAHARWRVAVSAVLLMAAPVGTAWAQVDTVELKPGLWRVTAQLWLDGKEVLGEIDAAGARATAKVLEQARKGMSAAERAEFDRNLPPRESARVDTECISAAEASVSPEAALRAALDALQQPPWICSTSNARSSTNGHSFDYRCRTPANAIAEGKARFEVITERRYRSVIEGRSHVVNMETGKPLDARIVSARALTTGYWQAESCQP
ncbi:MAG: DUF3617 family protein [Burkholderiaceae bacterium]|nr:DUF3617 family protein [Burkholderiaceae bacterium]